MDRVFGTLAWLLSLFCFGLPLVIWQGLQEGTTTDDSLVSIRLLETLNALWTECITVRTSPSTNGPVGRLTTLF